MIHECRNPLHCIVPPHMLDRMIESKDPKIRRCALDLAQAGARAREHRALLSTLPIMAAIPSAQGTRERLVYDAQSGSKLPGTLRRREGNKPTKDAAVDEAYDGAGDVYDFYRKIFDRNSLDDHGMSLISTVHYRKNHANAYWNGEQMLYGDGDGALFLRFTRALDVIGHEFTHGVVSHTSNLEYADEPGALNEHFADVFGVLVEQWKADETAKEADWLVGEDLLGPKFKGKAIRSFRDEPAYDDPNLGPDPQPKHMKDKYEGSDDEGGVHINSGIPNHAFYRFATSLGGRAFGIPGKVWYAALLRLKRTSGFADMVRETRAACQQQLGGSSDASAALDAAWKAVGLL